MINSDRPDYEAIGRLLVRTGLWTTLGVRCLSLMAKRAEEDWKS